MNSNALLIADSSAGLLPPLTAAQLAALVAGVLLPALALRWLLGPANSVSRRYGLWAIRGLVLAAIGAILLNPVWIDELPGPMKRPEIFYLLDTSASMQMGNPRSRWDESLALIERAHQLAASSPAEVKPFRFGQRLSAIESAAQLGLPTATTEAGARLSLASARAADGPAPKAVVPSDGDTRMLAALRQISSRFGRVPPQGIVLFSDGRAHDEAGVAQLAAEFARLNVPIHVVPVGDTNRGGDVAVSAVVAPPRVRKFTEVDVQVFVRSFGYDGKRSEVQLLEVVDNQPGRLLASLPITLQSGFQSVSLTFRTDLSTRQLRVAIPTLPDEVSDRNNRVDTEMAIDRTKIRVLYVEGSPQPMSQIRVGDRYQMRGPFSDFKQALIEDEDIECVVLVAVPGVAQLQRIADYAQADGVRGFPTTVAELAAFDAIVLSNVSTEAFTETQFAWIEQWIGQRGGGLCMVGGEHSFATGGWNDTPIAAMLPVELAPGGYDWLPGEQVKLAAELPPAPHALWNLVADDKQNRQIVASFPAVFGINRWAGARPNLATVLATSSVSGLPTAPPQVTQQPLTIRSLTSVLQGLGGSVPAAPPPAARTGSPADLPAIVAGRYGKGRTLAVAFPITSPYADELVQKWGQQDNRYYSKFCRNLVYWLTESSAIGRRRLVASADKRFYRPGETIKISAATYDESASPTRNYRVVAMVEPHMAPGETEPETSPLKWPTGLARTSGEEGPFIVWGEEFDLAHGGIEQAGANAAAKDRPVHSIELPLSDILSSATSSQSLRVELTAYEDLTQVDSTSLDVQVLHDPFEQQNPFPNHALLAELAKASGGKVLRTPADLAAVLADVPVDVGPPTIRRSPLWSSVWLLGLLIGLLTVEWCWRRSLGLA